MSPETFKKEFLKANIGYICHLSWANILHREIEAGNTTSNIAIYNKTGGYWPKTIDISRKTEIQESLTSYGMNEFMRLRDDQSMFELLFEDALKSGDPSAAYHKLPGNQKEVNFSEELTRTEVYELF